MLIGEAAPAPVAPPAGAPVALPPELAELSAVAAAADAALTGADLPPGVAPPPEVDHAAELGDMLTLGIKVGSNVLPPLAKHFPPDTCQDIASAYLACAEKYGWTWHEKTGGPEVRLGVALAIPSFLCFMETRAWLQWRREQAEAEARANAKPATGDPLAPLPAITA